MTAMKIKALAPWFGSNRTQAEAPGKMLRGCEWVGIREWDWDVLRSGQRNDSNRRKVMSSEAEEVAERIFNGEPMTRPKTI
jgi:hypothetical protein